MRFFIAFRTFPFYGTLLLALWKGLRPEGLSYRIFEFSFPSLYFLNLRSIPAGRCPGCRMFVHLHCHSHYSFLRGVNPPQEIIAAAVEQKMPAVALTDTNGMYAAVP